MYKNFVVAAKKIKMFEIKNNSFFSLNLIFFFEKAIVTKIKLKRTKN